MALYLDIFDNKAAKRCPITEFYFCKNCEMLVLNKFFLCSWLKSDSSFIFFIIYFYFVVDADYQAFLEQLEKQEENLPSAEVYIEEIQARNAVDKNSSYKSNLLSNIYILYIIYIIFIYSTKITQTPCTEVM